MIHSTLLDVCEEKNVVEPIIGRRTNESILLTFECAVKSTKSYPASS